MTRLRDHDIEKISAYLDGQLSSSESAVIESRLKTDPDLASAFDDMRLARGMLRRLPKRKAPRNFMLSRKMVKANPPVPRTFSLFQFSSAFSALLLIFTFAFNYVSPRVSYTAAPGMGIGGYGGGGGGGSDFGMGGGVDMPASAQEIAPPAAEEPAPTAEAFAANSGPADSADATRKEGEAPDGGESLPIGGGPAQPIQREYFIVSAQWQAAFLLIAILTGLAAFGIRWNAKRKWN